MQTYTPPVAQLLTYGDCRNHQKASDWPDYVQELGFTQAHVPQLLTLMLDDQLLNLDPDELPPDFPDDLEPTLAYWAPFHAWRVLGQLQAPEFLPAAIAFLDRYEIDWAWEEFPDVFALIGPAILPELGAAVTTIAGSDNALTLIDGMARIVEKFPEARDRHRELLLNILNQAEQNHDSVNADAILGLIKIQANDPEALAAIEAAYQAGKVDQWYVGTWPRVQVDLGVKAETDFAPAALVAEVPPAMRQMREWMEQYERQRKPDAFALGMPIDRNALPSTKPLAFSDIAQQRTTHPNTPKPGFGTATDSQAKKKKKKK